MDPNLARNPKLNFLLLLPKTIGLSRPNGSCYLVLIYNLPMDSQQLSDRELEILELVAIGKSNKEIAVDLFISSNTVKVHLSNIFQKLSVSSRTEAVYVAKEQGLVLRNIGTNPLTNISQQGIPALVAIAEKPNTAFRQYWIILSGIAVVLLVLSTILIPRYLRQTSPRPQIKFESIRLPSTPAYQPVFFSSNGRLMFASGFSDSASTQNVELLTDDGSWEVLTEKPTPLMGGKAATLEGKIYFPGGTDKSGNPTKIHEVFDTHAVTWSTAAQLPKPLSGYALTVFEGYIYLFGGWDGSAESADVYRYEPRQDRWVLIGELPKPRLHCDAVVYFDRILVVGGTNNGTPQAEVLSFQPQSKDTEINWDVFNRIPFECNYCNIENIGDILFAVNPESIWQYSTGDKRWFIVGKIELDVLIIEVITASQNGQLYIWVELETGEFRLLRTQLIYTLAVPGVQN